jgi:uncharacterized membrane protein YbhN (UPF0104 family)
LLLLLFSLVDWGRLLGTLGSVSILLYLLAIVIFMATYLPLAKRWHVLAHAIGYEFDVLTSFRIVAISYGMNKLLPANAGDLARSKITERFEHVESHTELIGMVAVERFFDVSILVVLLVLTSLIVPLPGDTIVPQLIVVVTIGLLLGAAAFTRPNVRRLFLAWTPGRIRQKTDNLFFGYRRLSTRAVILGMGLTLLRWVLAAAVLSVVVAALGIRLDVAVAIFVVGLMSLVTILPISSGGIGPVEVAGTGAFVVFGFEYHTALSIIVLQRSLGLVLTAIVGLAVYYHAILTNGSRIQ